jgi:hypothetical protein
MHRHVMNGRLIALDSWLGDSEQWLNEYVKQWQRRFNHRMTYKII